MTSSPGANPLWTSQVRIGCGYACGLPANTVTTVAPGCTARNRAHPSTASSRCGETTTTRSSSPSSGRPHLRIGNEASRIGCDSAPSGCAAVMTLRPPTRLLVQGAEFRVAVVVDRAVRGVGDVGALDAHVAREIVDADPPERDAREERGTTSVGAD